MVWVLVFVVLSHGEVHADYVSTHDQMSECFSARESLATSTGGTQSGQFPKGQQAVCVHTPLVHAE
jgi:hypothetical protein